MERPYVNEWKLGAHLHSPAHSGADQLENSSVDLNKVPGTPEWVKRQERLRELAERAVFIDGAERLRELHQMQHARERYDQRSPK